MKKKCFLISLVLVLMIFVLGGCKNNMGTVTTTEMITESTTVVRTEEITEKKEAIATTEETTEKKTTEAQTEKSVVGNTEYVASITTTKEQESTTKKQETITKKPVTTTKAPTTTKKPTTTKDEYYPSLTASDMEELKRYAISYIESRGYRADPDITWSNAGYYVTVGLSNDLSSYGDEFKIKGGAGYTPLEYAKQSMKGKIDWHIKDWERANGPDSIYGMYPLVRNDADGWEWTIGYW